MKRDATTREKTQNVIVVMPAYNAAATLEKTYRAIPRAVVSHVILVDDCSQDNTCAIARKLGLEVVQHERNLGYGGNQKTCYRLALEREADIIVMLHPDYQYDPTCIPNLIDPIIRGEADLVLGSRLLNQSALEGGMPLYKYLANRFLTTVENGAFGTNLSEFHTGFRAYSRTLLETIPFVLNSDDFVFDSELVAQAVATGFTLAETAVPTRYFPEASSINFKRSMKYGFSTLGVVGKFMLHRVGVRRSVRFQAVK